MSLRNVELFDRIADRIEKEPESYDQRNYAALTRCGTAFCIAGHAATLCGWSPRYFGDENAAGRLWQRVTDGALNSVVVVAASALGLSWDEYMRLFAVEWNPPAGETVPQALRRIGRGGAI